MAYDFVKLSETPLVESVADPNLIVEDAGEIVRLSANHVNTPQLQSDWNETDETSPAFILNKPEIPETSAKINVITYTIASGALMLNGGVVTTQSVVDSWSNGDILRVSHGTVTSPQEGAVLHISYTLAPGGTLVDKSGSMVYSTGVNTSASVTF